MGKIVAKGVKRRKPHSLHEDVKLDVLELREDGISLNTIAWYLGLSYSTVQNIINPEKYQKWQATYRNKNKARWGAYNRNYYHKNRESRKQQALAWAAANPEKARESSRRAYIKRKLARMGATTMSYSAPDRETLMLKIWKSRSITAVLDCGCNKTYARVDIPEESEACEHGNYYIKYHD